MKKIFWLVIVMSFLFVAVLSAEDKFGVKVYPGAKFDQATSKALKEQMGFNGFCYRTSDSVQKVADFYKKEGLTLMGSVTKEAAMYQTKTGVDVTIQSPWMDMASGKMMKDTLISIVKQGQ